MTKSTKNANRTTEVKFMYWNQNEGGTPYERTEKIAYTRSVEIARKTLVEMFPDSMIQVIEPLIQENITPIEYDNSFVMSYAISMHESKDEANEIANETQSVIPFVKYDYSAQIWAIDTDGNYFTDWFVDDSPTKFGKIDTRGFIKMAFEQYSGAKVIGLHDDKRQECKLFAIVNNEDVDKCIKASK